MKKTKRAFSGAERGLQNTLPDLRLEALVNEVSEIVQDRQISEILSAKKSRGGHCAAATEAVWAIIKADPRFEGLKVKIQILKPLNPENDTHYRIYDINEDVYYDPTSYQFTTPFETLYDPDDKSKTRFVGLNSMRTEAPYTNRFSTLTIIDEFYKRFPHEKKIKVLSDTREGPRLQLVSEVVISSADAPLFANAYNLIGQEVEVHTNRTKKIWSIKDPNNNDKLIAYAKDTVVLKNVTWTQPSLGVARRTFHQTDTGARTGERSVQAFAQGILVAFDDLPVPHEIKSEMSQCEPIKLTYRPINETPEWVGAFRDRNTREGVSTSKFAKLDWVTLPNGTRVADAEAYCEIVYIDHDELEDFRQKIIRQNGARLSQKDTSSLIRKKTQSRRNPILLPRAELVDVIFEIVLFGLNEHLSYCRSLPKTPKLTLKYINYVLKITTNFFSAIKDKFRNTYLNIEEQNNHIKLIKRLKTLAMYSISTCYSYLVEMALDNETSFIINTSFNKIYPLMEQITESAIQSDFLIEKDQWKLKDLQTEVAKFIESLYLFSNEINTYLGNNFQYEGSLDHYIDEFKPRLPAHWIDYAPMYGFNDRWYDLPADICQVIYGVNRNLAVKVKNIDDRKMGECSYDESRYSVKIYCMPAKLEIAKHLNTPEEIYSVILHECVHLIQASLSSKVGSFNYTGLPFERQEHFRQYLKHTESVLKLEYQIKGLDPDLVDFHKLDDVEFYSLLFDRVINFIKINFADNEGGFSRDICNTDIEAKIKEYIDSDSFFKTLKHFQIGKYELAVHDFKVAVLLNFEFLEELYVCKIRDASEIKKRRIQK